MLHSKILPITSDNLNLIYLQYIMKLIYIFIVITIMATNVQEETCLPTTERHSEVLKGTKATYKELISF